MTGRRTSARLALALACLALAGCGDINPTLTPPVGPTTGPSASASASVAPTLEPGAKAGECFAYTTLEHLILDSTEPHVGCERPHTAQTVLVGELSSTPPISFADAQALLPQVEGPGGLASLPSDLQQQYLALMDAVADTRQKCQGVIDTELGLVLPNGIRRASLFRADLTGPTPQQWDSGDRWIRCNLVAVLPGDGAPDTLVPFTEPLSDLMTASDAFLPCWTGTAGERRPLACTSAAVDTRTWVTLTDDANTPAISWPGEQGAAKAAESLCRNLASSLSTAAAPSVVAWGASTQPDGSVTAGFSADTWGTDAARVGCAIPLSQLAS